MREPCARAVIVGNHHDLRCGRARLHFRRGVHAVALQPGTDVAGVLVVPYAVRVETLDVQNFRSVVGQGELRSLPQLGCGEVAEARYRLERPAHPLPAVDREGLARGDVVEGHAAIGDHAVWQSTKGEPVKLAAFLRLAVVRRTIPLSNNQEKGGPTAA